jgi:Amt family ammonium transporter
MLITGIIIFMKQAGFALIEVGSSRNKNHLNILLKNLMDAVVGGLAWWCIGFAIAYGNTSVENKGNGINGTKYYFGSKWDDRTYGDWFF